MPWDILLFGVFQGIVLPAGLWLAHKRWPEQMSFRIVFAYLTTGLTLGTLLLLVIGGGIDENFGKPITWRAHGNFPIVLETRWETGTKSSPIGNGITTYSETWLYLHMNGETFKCKYWHTHKKTGGQREMSEFLYIHSKGKIELAEITASFARGEQAIHKNRLKYCSIKKMRFRHFADVEYIAASVADSGLQIYGNRPYPEYLQTYKEYFFQ